MQLIRIFIRIHGTLTECFYFLVWFSVETELGIPPTENMRGMWFSPLAKSFSKFYGAHRSCPVFPEIKRSNKTGHSLEFKNYPKARVCAPGYAGCSWAVVPPPLQHTYNVQRLSASYTILSCLSKLDGKQESRSTFVHYHHVWIYGSNSPARGTSYYIKKYRYLNRRATLYLATHVTTAVFIYHVTSVAIY